MISMCDLDILKDDDADDISTITLSYTFFKDQDQSATKELAMQSNLLFKGRIEEKKIALNQIIETNG